MLIIDFLIGIIDSSFHSSISKSELFSDNSKILNLFQLEHKMMGIEDSNKIGKATFKLEIVLGITTFLLSIHYKIVWYFSIEISLGIVWMSLLIIGLVFVLIVKHKQVKN